MLKKPNYVDKNDVEKENFLNRIESFDATEKKVFCIICEVWKPLISFEELKAIRNKIKGFEVAFNTLSKKLEQLNVLVKKYIYSTDGSRSKKLYGIVLCEPNKIDFYNEFIDECIKESDSSFELEMVDFEHLQKKLRNNNDVEKFSKKIEMKELVDLYFDPNHVGFLPEIMELNGLIFTRHYASSILEKIKYKIKRIFEHTPNAVSELNFVLKINRKNIIDGFSKNDYNFWHSVANVVKTNPDNLERCLSKFVYVLDYIKFVHEFLLIKKEKEVALERERSKIEMSMKQLEYFLFKKENGFLSFAEFDSLVNSFKNSINSDDIFQKFKDEIKEKLLKPSEGYFKLAVVNNFEDKFFIHKDRIFDFFIFKLTEGQSILKNQLQMELEHSLDQDWFLTREGVERKLEEIIFKNDFSLSCILENPILIAEAIVEKEKKKSERRYPSIRTLYTFFHVSKYIENIKFKDCSVLFRLDLDELYRKALIKVNFITYVISLLTGKIRKMNRAFHEMKNDVIESASPVEDTVLSGSLKREKTSHLIVKQNVRRMGGSKASTGQSFENIEKEFVSKILSSSKYTDDEIENAWIFYQDAIYKDKAKTEGRRSS